MCNSCTLCFIKVTWLKKWDTNPSWAQNVEICGYPQISDDQFRSCCHFITAQRHIFFPQIAFQHVTGLSSIIEISSKLHRVHSQEDGWKCHVQRSHWNGIAAEAVQLLNYRWGARDGFIQPASTFKLSASKNQCCWSASRNPYLQDWPPSEACIPLLSKPPGCGFSFWNIGRALTCWGSQVSQQKALLACEQIWAARPGFVLSMSELKQ